MAFYSERPCIHYTGNTTDTLFIKNKTKLAQLTLCMLATLGFTACDSGYTDNTSSFEHARLTLEEQENLPRQLDNNGVTYCRNQDDEQPEELRTLRVLLVCM